MTFTAMAAEEKTGSKKIKITELPIYDAPEVHIKFVKEEPCKLQQQISKVRKFVWKWMDSVQGTTDKIKDKYEIGKAHTQSTIDMIQNEPGILPRVGVITAAGLGGAIAGFRGGVIRKISYGSVAAVTAAAFCYPNEAVDIGSKAYEKASVRAKEQWEIFTDSDQLAFFKSQLGGWSGVAMVSCILRHRGVQLKLAYSWARPAILVAGKNK